MTTAPTFTPPALTEFQERFLREWSEDLQTTDAIQGTGTLCRMSHDRSFVEFCCLGRAGLLLQDNHADWLAENGFCIEYRAEEPGRPDSDTLMVFVDGHAESFDVNATGNSSELPPRLARLLGLGESLPLGQPAFYTANDDHDRTFPEIGVAIDMALAGDYASAERQLD